MIGGGDVSPDRLLPDLLRSFESATPSSIRYPDAVRPWQHVLDCLAGYLALVDALLDGRGTGEWNFGPGRESFVPVRGIADAAAAMWGDGASWIDDSSGDHVHEANLLALDAAKAERELGWSNVLPYPACLEWTVAWQKRVTAGEDARAVSTDQLDQFLRIGVDAQL